MLLGRHTPLEGNLSKTVRQAAQMGCQTIQIFASNPTGWKPPKTNATSTAAFRRLLADTDLRSLLIHAPYLINLASPDATILEKSRMLLRWNLERAAELEITYVVFHVGSHRGSGVEAGLARLIESLHAVLADLSTGPVLLLENDVGAGNELGFSFEHLATLLEGVNAYSTRTGVCLDTAHLWGAGYDISTPEGTLATLADFGRSIGFSRLLALHINDTPVLRGSHRDNHARLGEGQIPLASFAALLRSPELAHIATVLETPIENYEHDCLHFKLFQALADPAIDVTTLKAMEKPPSSGVNNS